MCPFCNDVDKEGEILEIDDYVSPCPMTWCWNYGCESHSVLLEDNAQIIDKNELPDKLRSYLTDDLVPYKIPLAKIIKIMNRQFYSFKYDSNLCKDMTECDMREMIELSPGWNESPSNEFNTFLNKWGIKPRDDQEFDDYHCGDDNSRDFTLHLPVNSYNVEDPEQPYPKNFDLAHDGIYIYLQCLDINGNPFIMTYWGD